MARSRRLLACLIACCGIWGCEQPLKQPEAAIPSATSSEVISAPSATSSAVASAPAATSSAVTPAPSATATAASSARAPHGKRFRIGKVKIQVRYVLTESEIKDLLHLEPGSLAHESDVEEARERITAAMRARGAGDGIVSIYTDKNPATNAVDLTVYVMQAPI